MKKLLPFCVLMVMTNALFAQPNNPPGLKLIRTEDLKADLYAHADAKFKGRSAVTMDELKAAAWLAEKYKAIGLKPAGDDSTYFQFFTLWRNHISDNSSIQINDKPLVLWQDVTISQMANVNLSSPILYLGNALDMDTTVNVKGKIVAFEANAEERDTRGFISIPTMSSLSGFTANCTLQPPANLPMPFIMRMARSRMC